ncbi:MAG: multiheme c-type cytochrome [Myxococcaceae bacterium]
MTHVRRKFPPRRWLAPAAATLLLLWCALGAARQLLAASATADGGTAMRLALFVTADLQGQLLPCGCSAGMRGGLGRAAAQLARARAEGLSVVYLDAGDALFDRAGLQPDEAVEEERKAKAVAEALQAMGLAARATGPLDDVQGVGFRRSLGLPELSRGSSRVLEAGGHHLGVVVARSATELSELAARVRGQGADFVVALYGGSLDAAIGAVRGVEGVDLVVSAQDAAVVTVDDESRLVKSGVPVARVQSRGRALLRADLVFDGTGRFRLFSSPQDVEREAATLDERVSLLKKELALPGQSPERKRLLTERLGSLVDKRAGLAPAPPLSGANGFTVRFVPLEVTLPSDPEVDAVVQKFDAEVSQLNLAWAGAHGRDCPGPKQGEASYLGNAGCEACHAAAFGVYRATGHARAYLELEKVHKQYRLECVACHVVGIQQPGGVCRVDRVAGRDAVGCENCHGPGSLHAALPGSQPMPRPAPTRAVCAGCHTPENSPHFDYSLYLQRVLGPGHGAKR